MLMRRFKGNYILKLNKEFYDIDKVIHVLTKYEKYLDNSVEMDFSSISDNKYIRVHLIPKMQFNIIKLIHELT
jgi:hypothetical protein